MEVRGQAVPFSILLSCKYVRLDFAVFTAIPGKGTMKQTSIRQYNLTVSCPSKAPRKTSTRERSKRVDTHSSLAAHVSLLFLYSFMLTLAA